MKSGTGDDPFGDEQTIDESDEQETVKTEEDDAREPEKASNHPSSIPYKFRRETVKEGRDQIQFFLRESILQREEEFIDTLEDDLGENVYVTDAREAAVLYGMRNPEDVAEIMREWGYDFD